MAERARVPGSLRAVECERGGGVLRFARSELRVVVTTIGAVFWGWDGAGPEPSEVLAGPGPEPDPRAVLEPDKLGGRRVVAERVTVVVSRDGAVEVRTPGGVSLRRDPPPRWWETGSGGGGRWMQRSEVPADARFFAPGARAGGPLLRDGTYRFGGSAPGGRPAPGDEPCAVATAAQVVVAGAGTHLAFHDARGDGVMTLREGVEGAGSGHDRRGSSVLRMAGGPLRCWVIVGTPARVAAGWESLTGTPALPATWGTRRPVPGAGPR